MNVDVITKRCRVLRGIFGTNEYTPKQVAELRWLDFAKINGCGKQTIDEIRRWLNEYDLDIKDVPSFIDSPKAKDQRLLWAMVELELIGFSVGFPKS